MRSAFSKWGDQSVLGATNLARREQYRLFPPGKLLEVKSHLETANPNLTAAFILMLIRRRKEEILKQIQTALNCHRNKAGR
jgi:hypothetical protein